MRRLWLCLAMATAACEHPLLLKKYQATSPKRAALASITVRVVPFADARELDWDDQKSQPRLDPKGFAYRPLTQKEQAAWELERDTLEETIPKTRWISVGQVRNAFGMPVREFFSVNAPADWLTEAARLELAAQGAHLVDTADADVVVQATLRYASLELLMAEWAHLVLDVTTTVRGQPPKTVRLHTSDGRLAWSGNEVEAFEVFSATEQKLSWHLIEVLAKEVQAANAGPRPLPL